MSGKVVHCKREDFDVYIGRPGPFGNPFKVAEHGHGVCIEMYREWLYAPEQWVLRQRMAMELRDKVLGCWCAPRSCHGDVILEWLAAYEEVAE